VFCPRRKKQLGPALAGGHGEHAVELSAVYMPSTAIRVEDEIILVRL
jgi:hypothetical protein